MKIEIIKPNNYRFIGKGGAPIMADDFGVTGWHTNYIAERHYYPYGLALGQTDWDNPNVTNVAPGLSGFGGKDNPEEAWWGWAFQDFGARQYDPQLGRWTAGDPMYQTASSYDYCGGDPMMRTDPSGAYFNYLGVATKVTGIGLAARVVFGNNKVDNWARGADRWIDNNPQTVANIGVAIAGLATIWIPGVNVAGAMAIGAGLGALSATASADKSKPGWGYDVLEGAAMGAVSSVIGAGAGQIFANSFLGLSAAGGMALQGLCAGAVSGAASAVLGTAVHEALKPDGDLSAITWTTVGVGAVQGGIMGAAAGGLASLQNGASARWTHRRLLARALREVNKISPDNSVNFRSTEEVLSWKDGHPAVKSLFDQLGQSTIQLSDYAPDGQLIPADNPMVNSPRYGENNQYVGGDIKVTRNAMGREQRFGKLFIHEGAHISHRFNYPNYSYSGHSNSRDERWIRWNFHQVRTGGFE